MYICDKPLIVRSPMNSRILNALTRNGLASVTNLYQSNVKFVINWDELEKYLYDPAYQINAFRNLGIKSFEIVREWHQQLTGKSHPSLTSIEIEEEILKVIPVNANPIDIARALQRIQTRELAKIAGLL